MASAQYLLQLLLETSIPEEGRQEEGFRSFLVSFMNCESKFSRLSLLKQYFKLEDTLQVCNPGEYDGNLVLLDLVEETLMFAINKGFPCHKVHHFFSFYVCCLDLVAKTSSTLSAIQKFKDVIIPKYSTHFSQSHLSSSVNYIAKSIFQHFHLYQFLLTQSQTMDITALQLQVDIPSIPQDLNDGIPEDIWLEMKKRDELKEKHDKRMKELQALETEAIAQADADLKQAYISQLAHFSNGPVKMSPEDYADMVKVLTQAHLEYTRVVLSQSLFKQNLELDFRLSQIESMSLHHEIKSDRTKSPTTTRSKSPTTPRNKSPTTPRTKSPATPRTTATIRSQSQTSATPRSQSPTSASIGTTKSNRSFGTAVAKSPVSRSTATPL